MGAWGPGIYQDDVALDIKEEYIELLRKGKTKEEADAEIKENNADYLEDIDDIVPMVLALADTEWKYGKLMPQTKELALGLLACDDILDSWKENKSNLNKRRKVLETLKERLESEMPVEKVVKPWNLYKCQWQLGDAYAYKLESEYAKENGLYGRYIILIKVDERSWYPGHIIPIVWVKLTENGHLPANEEELNNLEFVKQGITSYEKRLWPITEKDHDEMEHRRNFNYKFNKYGFLNEYRCSLISTSKRIIPKKLVYLGNYENIKAPFDEFIPWCEMNILKVEWKNIEEELIKCYYLYNKEEVYRKMGIIK